MFNSLSRGGVHFVFYYISYASTVFKSILDDIFFQDKFIKHSQILKFNEITQEQKGVKGGKCGKIKALAMLQPKQVLFLLSFNFLQNISFEKKKNSNYSNKQKRKIPLA